MGTGSAGGGGSGGGSGGSGGGGLSDFDYLHFEASKGPPSARKLGKQDNDDLRRAVIELLSARSRRSYLHMQLSNAVLAEAYAVAFDLGHDASDVARRLAIDPGPGFVLRLIETLAARWLATEPDERIRDTARATLEDFVLLAMGDRISIYLEGDCAAVQKAMRRSVVESTAGHFMGKLLWRLLEREIERLPKHETGRLEQVTQDIANDLLDVFEERYVQDEKSRAKTYASLFDLLGGGADEKPVIDGILRELPR